MPHDVPPLSPIEAARHIEGAAREIAARGRAAAHAGLADAMDHVEKVAAQAVAAFEAPDDTPCTCPDTNPVTA